MCGLRHEDKCWNKATSNNRWQLFTTCHRTHIGLRASSVRPTVRELYSNPRRQNTGDGFGRRRRHQDGYRPRRDHIKRDTSGRQSLTSTQIGNCFPFKAPEIKIAGTRGSPSRFLSWADTGMLDCRFTITKIYFSAKLLRFRSEQCPCRKFYTQRFVITHYPCPAQQHLPKIW